MNVLKELLENARKILSQMSSTQRASVLTMVITVASLFVLIVWFGSLGEKSLNVPLNVEVPLAQFDSLRELLTKNGISQVDYDPKAQLLLVPEKERYKALIVLAKANLLPATSNGGFEKALQETKFTDTKKITAERLKIALQNEVATMIEGIEGIDKAKVVYSDAEQKTLFRTPFRQRAAVKVKTAYNRPLTQDIADTIISLVTFSRAGLEERDVQVTDQDGRHFTKDSEENLGRVATKALEMNRATSNIVKKDIEELVRRAIPHSEAYVWVDTTWDLSRRKETEHILTAAMPKQTKSLKITDRHTDMPGNIVGTQPNIRRNANMQQNEGTGRKIERNYERSEKFVNNDFSYKDTENIPCPTIKKQTISVVVHLPYEYRHIDNDPSKGWIMEKIEDLKAIDPDAPNEPMRKQFPMEPLKDDALLALENAIRKAAGMLEGEEAREVVIQQIPWRPALEPDKRKEVVDHWKEFFASNAIPLILMAILLIAMVFLYLQAKRALPSEEVELPDLGELSGVGAAKMFSEQDRNQADFENLRSQIGEIIDEDPGKATSIIRRWMSSREG